MAEFGLIVGILLAAIGYGVFRTRRYYGQLFSDAHQRVLHGALLDALDAARKAPDEQPPSPEFGTAFVTYGDIGVGVTANESDDLVHVSFSQVSRVTTAAVGQRIGALILKTLGADQAELFMTPSRVHHIQGASLVIERSFDVAFKNAMAGERPHFKMVDPEMGEG